MARGSDINQRISLTGADEVRRHLEQIGQAGERSGNQVRANLLAATSGLNSFSSGARTASSSSREMTFAMRTLGFQVGDVATSLASGGGVLRTFAQQGDQIRIAFQQGGGLGPVLREVGTSVTSMITPMRLAAVAAVALAAEFAVVLSRAASAEQATRKFDVILKGIGDRSGVTAKQLEEATHKLRDVGLSASEAREKFQSFLQAGGRGNQTPQVVRIAAELEAVLGKGSMDRFIAAAAAGGPALEEFGKKLGIIPKVADDTQKSLDAAAQSSKKFSDSINDALANRGQAIADEQRNSAQAIADLTRKRGSDEEEAQLLSGRRIEQITRDSNRTINDLITQRNKENAAQLAAYNKKIEEAADTALSTGQSLLNQIENKITGAHQRALTPFQKALEDITTAWSNLQDTIAQSPTITKLISDLALLAGYISSAVKGIDSLSASIRNIPGLPGGLGDLLTKLATGGLGIPSFGGGGNGPIVAEAPIPGLAAGGFVRGPGTGTSDSMAARLSNGEFVMPALPTKMYLPQLEAMRSMMSGPIMPRSRMPRFAAGGLVTTEGGGSPIYLQFPGGATVGPMMGDRQVRQALQREARKAGLLSAGRKPSTA